MDGGGGGGGAGGRGGGKNVTKTDYVICEQPLSKGTICVYLYYNPGWFSGTGQLERHAGGAGGPATLIF